MTKKLLVLITAILSMLAFSASPAPAVGALLGHGEATCQRDAGAVGAGGHVNVYAAGAGYFEVRGYIYDPASVARTWTWVMYHDGDWSAKSPPNQVGTGTIIRSMLNFPGSDTIRFSFDNAAGTVSCTAVVTV